jgi:beta-lactamase class A
MMHKSFRLRIVLMPAAGLTAAFALALASFCQPTSSQDDQQLDQRLLSIAQAHHGHVALYAHNLKTGQTASLDPDQPVKTASVIKLGILLDAAEQIRAGQAALSEKLVLTHDNQVAGSGVLAQLTAPLELTLGDTLTLMIIRSDNTATNMAIDRLGLAHINATLRAAGLHQTVLYKKVFVPSQGPMPADQPLFGLGKTTPREMAAIMERFATCNLALDDSAPQAQLAAPQVLDDSAPQAQLAAPQVLDDSAPQAQLAAPQVLDDSAPQAQLAAPQVPADGPLCGKLLHMLRNQQDRDSLPRYIESLDTSEQGSAIANKTGALNAVRNDVALIATKNGPVVISAFTFDNTDQRWNGDNEAEQTLAKLAQAIVARWSPSGLDPAAFPWENPLAPAAPSP